MRSRSPPGIVSTGSGTILIIQVYEFFCRTISSHSIAIIHVLEFMGGGGDTFQYVYYVCLQLEKKLLDNL